MLDRENPRLELRPPLWRVIARRCEAAWPLEACGLVIDGCVAETVTPPVAADAFRLAARDALLLERALRRGARVVLWHSHTTPGAPAGMSARDALAAAPAGEPLHPGVVHLVVDLRTGPVCVGARAFRWAQGRFEPAGSLPPPAAPPH